MPQPSIPVEDCRKIQQLRAEGLSREEIAIQTGYAAGTISAHSRGECKHGVWEGAKESTPERKLEWTLQKILKSSKRKFSVEELADRLELPPNKIKAALTALEKRGFNVDFQTDHAELHTEIPKAEPRVINVSKFKGRTIRFGLTADNHLGSKYARMDVLEALFDIWADQGIDTVYQCGNMIDGEARFNKHDLLVHGMQNQVDYFVEHWPRREGIVTHFVTGDDHEGWYVQREGINIGQFIQNQAENAGRFDLRYLGHMEHDIHFQGEKTEAVMRIIHAGGGSAYATSYAPQKIVESYQGGEKPQILLVGHYHKAEYGYPREVHVVQAGCTEDQTPFMRKRKLQAHIGGWTIEFDVDSNGLVHRFSQQWHPFYDRSFYEDKQWGYRW